MPQVATHRDALFQPARDLVRKVHCPCCWHGFAPQESLFIAEDPRLLGDPVAGPTEPIRFLPSRFDMTGAAIDPDGARCTRLACPRCRQEFPRAMIEVPATIASVVGSPGAGKSHLLASAIWSMRRQGAMLGLEVSDAEPRMHARIHAMENALFGSRPSAAPPRLAKTETAGGDGYREVRVAGRSETVPAPFMFTVRHDTARNEARLLVLYDNAGEHFLPGADEATRPVTRHLGRSEFAIFVLDPTQDDAFRAGLGLPANAVGASRQDVVLQEMASRMRQHRGRRTDEPCDVPLVVALAKADLWAQALGISLQREPYLAAGGVDRQSLADVHGTLVRFCERTAPEFLATVRAAFPRCLFVPCSALGRAAGASGVEPQWAAAPFVAAWEWRKGGRLEDFVP
ncbi:MAG: hypothetical protein ACOYMI_06140 [Phycisphaerales bacterium]